MKHLFATLLFATQLFFWTNNAYAVTSDFLFSARSEFTVHEDGITKVLTNIKIINNTEYVYAESFTINLGNAEPRKISVYNAHSSIPFEVQKSDTATSLAINFSQRVAGMAEVNNFFIEYDSKEIAKKRGALWVVSIPGVEQIESFITYDAVVHVPDSFRAPTLVKPNKQIEYDQKKKNLSSNRFSFSKEDISDSGIEMVFGDFQLYTFQLTYHMQNPKQYPVRSEIALPPDTNYQDVIIRRITPSATSVDADEDGNWLATFIVPANTTYEIRVEGLMKVYSVPKYKEKVLSEGEKRNYTKSLPYWEADDASLQKIARELKTPEKIFQYVVDTLSYSFEKATNNNVRLGAKKALKNPTFAVCLEFTDLFVALARAAGIPSRSVEGYAYTENATLKPLSFVKDILHTWPEYYDEAKKTWIMVDPTWADTTKGVDYFGSFDFEHVAFVIKGKDSTYPIPAGLYKDYDSKRTDSLSAKDINISFAKTDEFTMVEAYDLINTFPSHAYPALPINGTITIRNKGNRAIRDKKLMISSRLFTPNNFAITTDTIPPFGSKTIPLSFQHATFLTNRVFPVTISFGDYKTEKRITAGIFSKTIVFIGGIICVVGTFVFFTGKIRRIFVQGKKWKDTLRRKSKEP